MYQFGPGLCSTHRSQNNQVVIDLYIFRDTFSCEQAEEDENGAQCPQRNTGCLDGRAFVILH